MEILTLILKVCAILGLFALMFLPLHDVTAWDDDSWYARFTVSALATVVWVGFILFLPGVLGRVRRDGGRASAFRIVPPGLA